MLDEIIVGQHNKASKKLYSLIDSQFLVLIYQALIVLALSADLLYKDDS